MTQTFDRHLVPAWASPDRAVVVGVDASDRSNAAVSWATTEALLAGHPLTLVHVLDKRYVPMPVVGEESDQHGWHLLSQWEVELKTGAPGVEVRKELAAGAVDACLIGQSADQGVLVVGRRGLGSFSRLLVGSTSLSVASHARVPVVVVPAAWQVEAHAAEPVVIGVDHQDVQPAAIEFAFTAARRRGVPLVAAHGRGLPDLDGVAPSNVSTDDERAEQVSADALERVLGPWREAHPDVTVSLLHGSEHPLTVLLDRARPTQLLVLGRHSNRRRGGFPFGSVARGVLHYADVPVAIVPPRP